MNKEKTEWLKRNPRPNYFNGTDSDWINLEMPQGKFWTWWRKNILGYKI